MPAPDFLSRDNAGFIDELYARYRREPDGLDPSWRAIFAALDAGVENGAGPAAAAPDASPEAQLLKPFGLVNSYRELGHLVARLDPLNGAPTTDPRLEIAQFGFTPADLGRACEPGGFNGPRYRRTGPGVEASQAT